MRTGGRGRVSIFTLCIIVLAIGLAFMAIRIRTKEVDPHAGQVCINDGFGMVWITPLEGVDVNNFVNQDFERVDGVITYMGDEYDVKRGIDVSEHQRGIDWTQVSQSGVDFAFIRVGYRGYSKGGLVEDAYFKANIEGALQNGIDVGVYIYSQAINVQEALEEAQFVLDRISGYNVTLPVVFDWEIANEETRTAKLDNETLNQCAVAFCEKMKMEGYEPCVYFNRSFGYYKFDLALLDDYAFWVAVPGEFPDFYYDCEFWQYSFVEEVPGVNTECDMNLWFIPKPEPAE